ncbi:hypothetical protein C8Q79DRAFT_986971, partial [Trametes meyenii]
MASDVSRATAGCHLPDLIFSHADGGGDTLTTKCASKLRHTAISDALGHLPRLWRAEADG